MSLPMLLRLMWRMRFTGARVGHGPASVRSHRYRRDIGHGTGRDRVAVAAPRDGFAEREPDGPTPGRTGVPASTSLLKETDTQSKQR